MSLLDPLFRQHLDRLDRRHTRRTLLPVRPEGAGRIRRGGRTLLNFSSNDYLGLASHPRLVERAGDWARRWGAGSTASRLVCGTLELHAEVEAKLARLKGTEAALLFNSGWQANAAVLPALFDRELLGAEALVFTDRLNHASLHHGCAAAGVRQIRFRHNDLDHLDSLLAQRAGEPGVRFVVTESVFSMDGDRADVPALAALAERHGAFLFLDEAHATGVLGPRGMGLAALGEGRVDLAMGTFSKALGGFGAYVAGSQALCDYLVNRCGGLIYATALPPAVLGAMDAALDLVPTLDAERARLQGMAERLRAAFHGLGIATAGSSTQIVPAITGAEEDALALSRRLEERGILGIAIRPPTVPPGTSRLRFALSAAHTDADLEALTGAVADAWAPA
ncbi:8-amino-7-oxononanoate synthase (plasmid) [Azospirillum sp. TSH58]|uniref:8-amino-7-oxononanoate synthase n=1 Tax=Azospirillum sp. TSH58 TaxID=664962 RepID=UPI000D5FF8A3|nr:8-amino-7-oxononanoate synthase [Azospirillum sp. TSH58]AWJ86044.1 8-amino-7-oxononanoate synthase [Azospirillum sp. TSH58]PWC60557.1 8-amino-7-oxononanoate synthase [Azospirillum sp. TSH58]